MTHQSSHYPELRDHIAELSLIDCHEHVTKRETTKDILALLLSFYLESDVTNTIGQANTRRVLDVTVPLKDRWPLFEKAWEAIRFTGYGQGTRKALTRLFGNSDPTLELIQEWQERIPDFGSAETFDPWITEARITDSISDNWPATAAVWDGTFTRLPWQHLAIGLPGLHSITRREQLVDLEILSKKSITSLDEYLAVCGELFERWVQVGAVCMKDQSAYSRSLEYGMPARSDAEKRFNAILSNPRYAAEYDPNHNPLSDYLMHAFMRLARDMDLPVQLHTGHMAGIRNDVAKANASGLRSLLEVHQDVQFDLFHANWPYDGDLLFLAKNYPNVNIDMCWAYAVDPIYSKEFLKRATVTVGHRKVHGFGSDVGGNQPHMIWAYAEMARDVMAAALSELVDEGFVTVPDAEVIARAWMIDNPRTFFSLT